MTPTILTSLLLASASLTPYTPPPLRPIPLTAAVFDAPGLRDYQSDLLAEVWDLLQQGYRRILVQLPTGGGKTEMAKAMLASATANDANSQFVAHRKELLTQTSKTLTRAAMPHGFISADHPREPVHPVMLAGVATLVNRFDSVAEPQLIILDEAHHATAATWKRIFEQYPDAVVIGLTATPERLDGRGLDEHFEIMVQGPSVAWLIDQGYLSPFEYYAPGSPTGPDTSGISTVGGDFNRAELGDLMDKPTLIGDAVAHYLRLAPGKPGICFAVNVEHSRHTDEQFNAAGVPCFHVDGKMDLERDYSMECFTHTLVDMLTNVELFGEGVDVPFLMYLIMERPTKSRAFFKQMCGRVLRPIYASGHDLQTREGRRAAIAAGPKPFAIIADHAGNAFTHGLPDDDDVWSLEGRRKQPRGSAINDGLPVRQCTVCFRVVPSTVATCPGCATEFPKQLRRVMQQAGELTKLERAVAQKKAAQIRAIEERACKSQADFEDLARTRGYENPRNWAKVRLRLRANAGRRR